MRKNAPAAPPAPRFTCATDAAQKLAEEHLAEALCALDVLAHAAYGRANYKRGHELATAYHQTADALLALTGQDPRPQEAMA
jgi:hypothetical protein